MDEPEALLPLAVARRIVDSNYETAKSILEQNVDKLHAMAKALVKYETIGEHQIKDIMEGREPRPPEDWDDSTDPTTPDDGSATAESDDAAGQIGGPASEH